MSLRTDADGWLLPACTIPLLVLLYSLSFRFTSLSIQFKINNIREPWSNCQGCTNACHSGQKDMRLLFTMGPRQYMTGSVSPWQCQTGRTLPPTSVKARLGSLVAI